MTSLVVWQSAFIPLNTCNSDCPTLSKQTTDPASGFVDHARGTPANDTESIAYGSGQATYTDPKGIQTVYTYDDDHNLTREVLDPSGLNRATTYTYNEFGEVVKTTDPKGNTTTNVYNSLGQLTSVTDPKGNTTKVNHGPSSYGNVDHEVTSVQTPQGGTYQFQYDKNHDSTTGLTPDDQTTGTAYNTNGTIAAGTYPISTADNPLENNSFEDWSNNSPSNWSITGASHSTVNSSDAQFGGHSLKITGAASGSDVNIYPSGGLYSISSLSGQDKGIGFEVYAKALTTAAAKSTRVQINFYNSSSQYIGQVDGTTLPTSGGWVKLTVVAPQSQFPSGATYFRPLVITDPTGSDYTEFDAADLVGYPLAPQYNAIVNGDFSYPNDPLHDWAAASGTSLTTVDNQATDTGIDASSDVTFGPYQKVGQITPNSSSWSGAYPTGSNGFIPYKSDQTYTAGVMLKGKDASSSELEFQFYDASKGYISATTQPISKVYSGTFGWQYVTATLPKNYSVPSGTAYIMPEVLVGPTSTSGAHTWFTEMRLTLDPNLTTYGYNSTTGDLTSVTDPLGHETKYGYDSEHNVTSVTDPLGHSLSMTYDADNELLTQASSPDNLKVSYDYDSDGNVKQVTESSTNGNQVYATSESTFNTLNQVTSTTDALGNTTSFAYDKDGDVTQVTMPDKQTIGVQYDNASEPTSITVNGATVNQYSYDADGHVTSIQNKNDGSSTSYGYDAAGNITSQTDNTGSQSFTYDKNNDLLKQAATIGSSTVTTNYNYNHQSQVTSITNGSDKNLATYRYNEQGLIDTVNLGNGLTETFRYDGDLHLTNLVIANGATVLDDYEYQYDADGNLTSVTNGETGASVASYGYDSMNRLTSYTDSSGQKTTYTYDALGNIKEKTVGSTTTTYTYNKGNQLTAVNGQAYTYNANGELTNSGSDTYKWNELGELTEVDNSSGTAIAIYQYDALGRRISEQANGTTTKFFYIGGSNLVAYETDGSGNLLQSYTYGANGEPLTLTTWSGGTGTTYYYHENGHGDVMQLTDSSGNTVAQYTYDPWGNVTSESGSLDKTNPYLYAGCRWDSAIGMYYLNARYYAPNLMQFISADPLGGLNAYTYTSDNPTTYADPTGEMRSRSGGGGGFNLPVPRWYSDELADREIAKEEAEMKAEEAAMTRQEIRAAALQDQASSGLMNRMEEEELGFHTAPHAAGGYHEGTHKVMEMENSDVHYQKHVVQRQEFGNISKDEYVKRANAFVDQKPGGTIQQASRIRDRTTITFDTESNEIGFVRGGKIQSYYRVNMANLPQFPSPIEYFHAVIK